MIKKHLAATFLKKGLQLRDKPQARGDGIFQHDHQIVQDRKLNDAQCPIQLFVTEEDALLVAGG